MPLGFFAAAAAQSDLSDAWPTVDCGALLADDGGSLAANGGGRSARGAALASLRSALETRGFFYCSNLDALMDADYIASVYEFSRRAHALPADVKRRFARPRGGYSGSDAGVEELAYEAGTTSAVRAWDYARENNSSQGFWFRNRYPDFSPPFEEFIGEPGLRLVVGRRDSVVRWRGATAVGDLFARQQRLAVALLEGLAEMLGLERDAFSRRPLRPAPSHPPLWGRPSHPPGRPRAAPPPPPASPHPASASLRLRLTPHASRLRSSEPGTCATAPNLAPSASSATQRRRPQPRCRTSASARTRARRAPLSRRGRVVDAPSTGASRRAGAHTDFGGARCFECRLLAAAVGAHTDFEAFTLMHQSAAGLQLRAVGEGAGWEDAPVRPAEFVVIIGDLSSSAEIG